MSERHIQRAHMLLSQERHELAEQEIRQALVQDPNNGVAQGILSICLLEQKKYDEATTAAGQAIHLAPDEPFCHYVMGQVMYYRNRFPEAREAVNAAIQLNPYDADFFALKAAIESDQKRWKDCLSAAEQGLQAEPDHVRCINLQALALTNLGRAGEARHSIDVALQHDPHDPWSHTNQGWTMLHQGKPKEAMTHFQEALRIDPNSEYARGGIIEAMKARNFIYRWLLAWFLYLSRLSPKVQMLLIVGIVFGQNILAKIAGNVPMLKPLVPLIVFGYLIFVWMSWCGPMLFNLVLRFDRFGRLALSSKQRTQSTIVGIYLLVALAWIPVAIVTNVWELLICALPFALALIPLNGVFATSTRGPFWIMVAITVAATACAFGPLTGYPEGFKYSILISLYSTWASLFFIGTSGPKKI